MKIEIVKGDQRSSYDVPSLPRAGDKVRTEDLGEVTVKEIVHVLAKRQDQHKVEVLVA